MPSPLRRLHRHLGPPRPSRIGLGLGLSAVLAACSGDRPSADLLQSEDRVALAPEERRQLDALLPTTDPPPLLVAADQPMPHANAVRIEDNRIDGLALVQRNGQTAADHLVVSGLPRLRSLTLHGAWQSAEVRELPALLDLQIHLSDPLATARIASLPSLEQLLVRGAQAVELPSSVPTLRSLSLGESNLQSLPPIDAPLLSSLALDGNQIEFFPPASRFPELESLGLSNNEIRTLAGLPELPKLRRLQLGGNQLDPQTPWPLGRLPKLRRLDLRRTGLTAVPPALAAALEARPELRVDFDEALDPSSFESTLEGLRTNFAASAEDRALALPSNGGRAFDRSGSCSWRTGVRRRAEVRCDLSLGRVEGTVAVRLGETDLAMPFSGGGAPRVAVELTVESGVAAVYLPLKADLIELARQITSTDHDQAQSARRPDDDFEGYQVAVARSGAPARVQGDVTLLGSRVVIWVSSDHEPGNGPAHGLRLTVRPPD